MFLIVLSPFNDVLVFVVAMDRLIRLCQHLLFALAANPMGDREGSVLRLFDPDELPAPRANDFEIHGFTSFLRA
jgi:hypothetical protein